MAFTQRQRRLVLGSVLVVTLILVFWPESEPRAPGEEGEPAKSAETGTAPAAKEKFDPGRAPAEAAGLRIARSDQAGEKREIRDLFSEQSWKAPPQPAPPGPPQAPPLPFTYLGKLIQDGQVTVYLADQEERNFAVRQGDVINGTYRVKRISPAMVTFVYIPMNKQQTLEIGRSN